MHDGVWFPGRLIGGSTLIAGPLLWLGGLALRHLGPRSALTTAQAQAFADDPFAAPSQLATYAAEPALVTAGYACFLAGAILLIPAIVTLAQIIAARAPALACWGGTLLVLGLVARAYFAGVDQTAFQMVDMLGLGQATRFVDATYVDISYGPWRVPVTASACQYVGVLLLAVGAYRSATFGAGRSLALLWAGTLWGGVLKASDDLTGGALLCLVLVPLGVRVLRDRVPELRAARAAQPRPARPALLSW